MGVSVSAATVLWLTSVGFCAAKDPSTMTGFVNLSFSVGGQTRTAALYVPPGGDASGPRPLIVYLHGAGGVGDNTGNAINAWMDRQPIVRAIRKNPERFPALVLIPRCPRGKIWAPVPADPVQSAWRLRRHGRNPAPDAAAHVTRAIDAVIAAYAVDEERITLTGHSMGGEGTTRYAALHADRFAGIAPSAGSAVIVPADAPALARMGVWLFQGEADRISTAALARRLVAAIREAGGTVRYTEYKGVGHATAGLVYADAKVIEWLLKQKRRAPAPAAGKAGPELCGADAASEVLADFSTKPAQVRAMGARVRTDGGLTVSFAEPGTGVMLTAPHGAWDLSRYVAVAIAVRNVGTKPVTLVGELNGQPWANSFLHVPAGRADTMVIHLPRKTLTDRRSTQFTGMKGLPGGHVSHWAAFDPGAVKTVTLCDLDGVSVGQTIEVQALRAVGRYGPLPPEKVETFFPFVDRFGQFKHRDWPGKVSSEADLRRFAAREADDLRRNPAPANWNRYGGWLGGPVRNATGHFRVEKYGGRWWLVDPEGRLFWSHGIDCVRFEARTRTRGREGYFEALPDGFHSGAGVDFAGANQHAKYGAEWEKAAIGLARRRLRSWGMNTVGNWSDPKAYAGAGQPYVVAIHYGGWGKETVVDHIRDPATLRKALRKRLAEEKGVSSEDPWCIGYFVDNEISWRRGMNAEVYYGIVREEVKRVAPNKLYLGSRLHGHDQPHGSKPHLVAAAAKHCDVVSINRYRFSPADLRMLDGVDVPLIIGEFHFGALDRGMIHPGLRGVSSQAQRAHAYVHYLTQALKHPNIVGAHWFQYREQNITGRGDGENYQIGFVDICDTPYPEIVDASRRIGRRLYEIREATPAAGPSRTPGRR